MPYPKQRLHTQFPLTEYFLPTLDQASEVHKAEVKNHNLLFLQFMYNGHPTIPLKCLLTEEAGWAHRMNYATKEEKHRFRLDFNHIRQRCNDARTAGVSVDKCFAPSGIFRSARLDPDFRGRNYSSSKRQRQRELHCIEFMCIMPILTEEHGYITQDSAKHDIVLTDFPKESWAWCLQNENNFESTKRALGIKHYEVEYDWLIDHLSSIEHDNIAVRLKELFPPNRKPLKG